MASTATGCSQEPIAIIGMACRFPGARNTEEFWKNLREGVESISFFSDEQLRAAGVDDSRLKDPRYVKARGALDDINLFDASFFSFTPREAELTDPQQRLFLEIAWQAFEDAGCEPDRYSGSIGVFAGIGSNSYLIKNLHSNPGLMNPENAFQVFLGNEKDFLATRVSYKLNLRGPSMNIQTACSTSLVAVHMACQSLLNYECDLALAGGATVRASQLSGYLYSEGGILSPDGHCRAFDIRSQGTVDGSGVGAVLLKRLDDALAERDFIHAVIRGSAINNDGSSKVGYTAPGFHGQAEVIAEAQSIARVDADTIGYIEAHGTATALGDPVEVAALCHAFRASTDEKGFCGIGSVKTNIGHLDTAAGVAGLIKTVLALKHKLLPPSLHFVTANTQINFDDSPFYLNSQLSEWKRKDRPLRAGVSSFGIGGTNAHVILEEAPAPSESGESRPCHLVSLSAKTASALETATGNLTDHVKRHPDINLADVAYSLHIGRKHFAHRRILVCQDSDAQSDSITALDSAACFDGLQDGEDRPVIFMFPGQGAQYVDMALGLYRAERFFREQVDRCCEILLSDLKCDLRHIMFPDAGDKLESERCLKQTHITQPALFVIEYALARQWMRWGLRPHAMIGHSLGEYVAACVAGVFSVEEALRLVVFRGRLMQSSPTGEMLALPLSEPEVLPLLGERLSLAAVNAQDLCVVAGPSREAAELESLLAKRGITARRLETSHAFHSALMDSILDRFAEYISGVDLHPPGIPYISNLTGTWITASQATSHDYWVSHLRHPVRFHEGLSELLKDPDCIFLETGPGQTLGGFVRRHPKKSPGQTLLSSIRHKENRCSDVAFVLESLGKLWLAGAEVDWAAFYEGQHRNRVHLPGYPFERKRFWIEPGKPSDVEPPASSSAKKRSIAEWFYAPSWKRSILAGRAEKSRAIGNKLRWLVFLDQCGFGELVISNLRQLGHEVISITAGDCFSAISDDSFEINPLHHDDYESLIRELRRVNRIPEQVLHLWSVSHHEELKADAYEGIVHLSFFSLLFLFQSLGQQNITAPIQVAIVSNEMQEVTGGENLCPEKATLLGPCRVASQEYPNITCRSIDLAFTREAGISGTTLAEQLTDELVSQTTDKVIAYRGTHRWVQTFEPIQLEQAADPPARLRRGGVYLITGGCGGIGLSLAELLARAPQVKLILIQRDPFLETEKWQSWLATHDDDDRLSRKIRKLLQLESSGAEVLLLTADVSDRERMLVAVEQARARFGNINGVIHAAGIAGKGIIQRQTLEAAASVLAPKVKGTRILESVFRGQDLDFFVLLSSLNSLTGGVGQVDYSASNAFLDAFAFYNSARKGMFTVSINWAAWQKVGMAAEARRLALDEKQKHRGRLDEVIHPLIDRHSHESSIRESFSTELSVSRHWILDEHRLFNHALVPGTGYLEMVRAAFQSSAGNRMMEIRDAFFLTPLWIRDDETKTVQIVLDRDAAGFAFLVRSKAHGSNGSDSWVDHVTGRIGNEDSIPSREHDIASLIGGCSIREIVFKDGERPKGLGPRWAAIKRIHIGERERLAQIELPGEFSSDLESYKLHPALLDAATGFAKQYEDGFYLPLSYKRLKLLRPLTRKLYSYARQKSNGYSRKETLEYDVTLMDERGVSLVEIEGFVVKRADKLRPGTPYAEADNHRAAHTVSSKHSSEFNESDPVAGSSMDNEPIDWILPEDGVEAFRRILDSSSLSQIIVSPKELREIIAPTQPLKPSIDTPPKTQLQITRAAHSRPKIETVFAAPINEAERTVAGIWQEVLGIDEIGRDDNFFELGGDSVQAIQIMAKANNANLSLTVQQLFQYQTIRELAEIAEMEQGAALVNESSGLETLASSETPFAAAGPSEIDQYTPADFPLANLDERKLEKLSQLITRYEVPSVE